MTAASPFRHISPARLVALAGTRTGVVALTTVGSLIVRMGSSIILTRLLTPSAFGLVGIVNSIFFTLSMLTDLGFQAYVVRHQQGDERHFRDVIWTIHAWRGFGLTIVTVAMAPIVAAFMHKPELTWPFAALASTFVLGGLGSLSLMTALRHDASRKLSMLDLGLQIFQTIACILFALWLRSVWAIIISMILQTAFKSLISYVIFPDAGHRLARDRAIQKDFFAFSRVVMASSILSLLLFQSDKLMLGRLLTLEEFGLYAIALNLASAPTSFSDSYISRVSFPVYAKTWREDPTQIREVYYSVGRATGLLYAFGCGGLIGGATMLVSILYDPRYQGAAAFLSLLSISAAFRLPNFAVAELMAAMGRMGATVSANIVRLVWLVAAGLAGFLTIGTIGLVAAVGLMELACYFYSMLTLRRVHVLDMRREFVFLACLAAGVTTGFLISRVLLWIWPTL
jgi:O-antigen/teichoic acid export membrane protein